ncbi:MAG: hypothetical protein ACRCX5_14330 [Bacteroidales bacterium]|uniref:hypothetical protein n=1 Tax=Clostridium chrysemydis TaxID=2665504 RepID=UPI003F2D1FEA
MIEIKEFEQARENLLIELFKSTDIKDIEMSIETIEKYRLLPVADYINSCPNFFRDNLEVITPHRYEDILLSSLCISFMGTKVFKNATKEENISEYHKCLKMAFEFIKEKRIIGFKYDW